MALPNYVKFQRGSLTAYNRLSQKDQDTLYFVYESQDASTGSLYLGNKLISNNVGGSGVNSLSELSDVIVTGANTGDFLVLNSESKWTAVSAADVAQAILTAGGNFIEIDENEFQFNAVNGKLELKGYATATAGLVPIKGASGLDWTSLPPDLTSSVTDLQTALNSHTSAISVIQTDLQSVDGRISAAIANANHLTRTIINDLSAATAENVIYLYPNNSGSSDNIYDEYMFIDGRLERTGSTSTDLSQYATITAVNALSGRVDNLTTAVAALEPVVGNLTTAVAALQNNLGNYVLTSTFNAVIGDLTAVNGVLNTLNADDSISETLIDIYERLTWQEISE